MTACDAQDVAAMMAGEDAAYVAHFKPFAEPQGLVNACARADKDIYVTLHFDGALAGLYMLRGWDAGYARPSFGIYVASRYQGRGIAKFALSHAESACRDGAVERMMLKVSAHNKVARGIYEAAGFQALGACADTGHIMMEKVLRG